VAAEGEAAGQLQQRRRRRQRLVTQDDLFREIVMRHFHKREKDMRKGDRRACARLSVCCVCGVCVCVCAVALKVVADMCATGLHLTQVARMFALAGASVTLRCSEDPHQVSQWLKEDIAAVFSSR
jgi:hypothetical protein